MLPTICGPKCLPSRRSCVVVGMALTVAPAGQTPARACEPRPLLADLARSREHRHLDDGQPAHRVERDQEPAVEGRDPGPRSLVADRLGRSGLRHHGGAGRRGRRGAARPARLAAAARRPPLRGHGPRSEDRQDGLAARRARSGAARAVARRQRHVGVQLAHHRRRAALRLLRVVRDLRLRHERQARCGRRTSATSACATSSARARRRRSTATRWSSSGII